MEVSLKGAFLVSKAAAAVMIKQGGGERYRRQASESHRHSWRRA
jgi:hypothetical protein